MNAAYDYAKQQWITGQQAVELRRTQLAEELELLESAQGEAYAKFINVDRMAAIAKIKAQF